MAELEPATMTFTLALAMGLVFGLGPCTVSCLPYLGPVYLAREGGLTSSWRTIVPFSLGRLSGYSALGLLAGLAGQALEGGLDSPWVPRVLGGATVLVGVSLLFREKKGPAGCPAHAGAAGFGPDPRKILPGGLYFMGLGMALNPCAPLGKLMLAASATTSASAGLSLGLGFGVGAVLVPSLVFGVGMAYLGGQIRLQLAQWRPALEKTSAVLLILLGARALLS